MSHTDYIKVPLKGFKIIAQSEQCPCAAIRDDKRKLYGVQFHPGVTHTAYGKYLIKNFLFKICGCKGQWRMEDFVEKAITKYKKELADKKVLLTLL